IASPPMNAPTFSMPPDINAQCENALGFCRRITLAARGIGAIWRCVSAFTDSLAARHAEGSARLALCDV
ncbi:MAG: hypothetical protein K2W86_15190, partial [Sphingomonas sp.]|uniref:hypothetical protein n=1 Tax=Sphingomonas sp. TaxID=28214 RepID=UPI0035A854EA|nr:hypothetical protein [Sphingomonas sp.]